VHLSFAWLPFGMNFMHMHETIERYEVIRAIDSGDPFDLVYLTADRRRGTGGEIKTVQQHCKVKPAPGSTADHFNRSLTVVDSRNPQHMSHRTINIFNPSDPSQHVIKIHWRLMEFFNGKRIIN
jgi:hypothetical protein